MGWLAEAWDAYTQGLALHQGFDLGGREPVVVTEINPAGKN
jgi:hypothetical protein